MEKKVLFFSKRLKISDINFNLSPFYAEVGAVVAAYLAPDPHFTVHTSGSTGTPKPIVLNKAHMRASALKTLEALDLKAGDRCLLCLSPNRIGGMMMLVRWLEGDLDLYLAEPQQNPLHDLNVPMAFAAMVPYQLLHSLEQIGQVDKIIVGGGTVSKNLEEKAMQQHKGLYHTYGMTETISHVALRPFGAPHFTALRDVHFAVDVRNCLEITAPHIGVEKLLTNDVVKLEDAHHFVWKGRYDNVVNSGGIKLYPEALEEKVGPLDFPYFLAGIPDAALGEKLIAVTATRNTSHEGGPLLQQLGVGLSKYERPKEVLEVEALLYTENGKLRRNLALYTD